MAQMHSGICETGLLDIQEQTSLKSDSKQNGIKEIYWNMSPGGHFDQASVC